MGKKSEETNAIIDRFGKLREVNMLPGGKYDLEIASMLMDIAKSLAIIADNTNENKNELSPSECLVVDLHGLEKLCSCGRVTAENIAEKAGAKMKVGRRCLYRVDKIKAYINQAEEIDECD